METGTAAPTTAASNSGSTGLEAAANEVESNELGGNEELQDQEQQQPQKYKVKVNGVEKEVTIDELRKRFEHAEAANEKFQKAAQIQKEYQKAQQEMTKVKGVFEHLKSNPNSFFELAEAIGVDLDKLAHEHVLKQYKLSTMSDDERRVYDMEQRLKQYESERERYAREEQERNKSATLQKARTDVETELVNFFTTQQVTPTPEMMERVLSDIALFANDTNTTLSEAIKRSYQRHETLMSRLEQQALERAIKTGKVPDELRTAFRKADVEKLGNPFRSKPDSRPPNSDQPRVQNRSSKPVTQTDDFFNRLEKKYHGRK